MILFKTNKHASTAETKLLVAGLLFNQNLRKKKPQGTKFVPFGCGDFGELLANQISGLKKEFQGTTEIFSKRNPEKEY